jgi:hypothetical protein
VIRSAGQKSNEAGSYCVEDEGLPPPPVLLLHDALRLEDERKVEEHGVVLRDGEIVHLHEHETNELADSGESSPQA